MINFGVGLLDQGVKAATQLAIESDSLSGLISSVDKTIQDLLNDPDIKKVWDEVESAPSGLSLDELLSEIFNDPELENLKERAQFNKP